MTPRLGFLLYGACTLITQLLCLQELLIVFLGHELFLGYALAAWMGWVGVGSWWARAKPDQLLGTLVFWTMPLLLANLAVIRLTKELFGFGMLIGPVPMLLLTTVLLAPVGWLIGALFTAGCARADRHGLTPGDGYLWDALGATLGGTMYSWLIAGRLPITTTLMLLIALVSAAGWVLTRRRTIGIMLVLTIATLLSPLPRATRQWQWRGYELLTERLSRYSHLVLARIGSLTSLFENGVIAAHFPDPAAYEELVHWPLLLHPAPRRVLVIGTAATGSLAEILQHPVGQVDYVELDPAIIAILRPALPPTDATALTDPRVHLIHQDGRRYLATASNQYDVILLQLPPPLNAQINRLYTLEAFQAIRRHLAPGGLVGFTIPSSENYLSPETRYFNACLFHTLRTAFPAVELVAGDPLLLVAGTEPIHVDVNLLVSRYQQRRLVTQMVVPTYFPIKLDAARRESVRAQLTAMRPPLNRDFVPVCYAVALRVWLSKFVSPVYFLWFLLLLALAVLLARALWRHRALWRQAPGPAALAALGCAGIVYETILLLAFQAIHGYVYWQLGALFAAFMLGLAIGSRIALTGLSKNSVAQSTRRLRVLVALAGLEGFGLAGLLPALQRLPSQLSGLLLFGPLLLFVALGVGLAFPLATRLDADQPAGRTAGRLYAADLWGAALGAVLTSAFVVPLLGLLPTLTLTGLLLLLVAWILPLRHSAIPPPTAARRACPDSVGADPPSADAAGGGTTPPLS